VASEAEKLIELSHQLVQGQCCEAHRAISSAANLLGAAGIVAYRAGFTREEMVEAATVVFDACARHLTTRNANAS
jgi:hypothetical protein